MTLVPLVRLLVYIFHSPVKERADFFKPRKLEIEIFYSPVCLFCSPVYPINNDRSLRTGLQSLINKSCLELCKAGQKMRTLSVPIHRNFYPFPDPRDGAEDEEVWREFHQEVSH